MLPVLPHDALSVYRAATFRTHPALRLKTVEQAVEFVNQRGFILFWPNKGINFPSLWAAVAGDRPVPDEHDDPGHITWNWKDGMLDKGVWYYARVLRRKNAMIALTMLPHFYALSPNYGEPDVDYLDQYQQGKMTMEAKSLYEALLREGPLDTLALRKAARLSDSRFNKALDDLQVEFKVLPVGVANVGAWRYAFIYDLVHRRYPNLIEDAGRISEPTARRTLLAAYFESLGVATATDAARLFRWPAPIVQQTLTSLLTAGTLREVQVDDQPEPCLAHHRLVLA